VTQSETPIDATFFRGGIRAESFKTKLMRIIGPSLVIVGLACKEAGKKAFGPDSSWFGNRDRHKAPG
jgi:hypothetical protein